MKLPNSFTWISFSVIIVLVVIITLLARSCATRTDVQSLHPTVAEIDSVKKREADAKNYVDSMIQDGNRLRAQKDSLSKLVQKSDQEIELKNVKISNLAKLQVLYRHYKDTASALSNCDSMVPQINDLVQTIELYRDDNQQLTKSYDSLLGTTSLALAKQEYLYSELRQSFDNVAGNAIQFEGSNKKLEKNKNKRFGLGVQLGATILNGKVTAIPSLGIHYSIIRF